MKFFSLLMFGLALTVSQAQASGFPLMFPGLPCLPGLPGCSEAPDAGADPKLPGSWTQGKLQNDFGSRDYYLYVAKSAKDKKQIPLMVMMHGCFQTATEFANQTGMNHVAERYGFAVLYPEEGYADNVWKCWNWFRPENQARNGGETGIVIAMIKEVSKKLPIDPKRVFAAGLSAGAAMASNLGACYSDIITGIGVHSGLEYKAATSEQEAHQVTRGGSSRSARDTAMDGAKCVGKHGKPVAVVAIHGKEDTYVNPVNTEHVVLQFTKYNDLLDDGKENDSQNMNVIASRDGDVPNGYHHRSDYYGGNGNVRIQKLIVDKMNHAWSGAHVQAQYADPKGPDAAEAIWTFLTNYASQR
ncbi:MAG: PHB depolymerase family esterase [Oligoflexia bacterium]|nr:PHB depolymerase family esterase [Oligoflexia bacterium]